MKHQANRWTWKGLATRLLLAPLAVGVLALPATAQLPAKPPGSGLTQTNPKDTLKLGRQALEAGKFDAAAQYAKQAAAANLSGQWGLFDDTPDSLLKATAEGKAKADKAMATLLTKDARDLYARQAKSDADRLANLDAAAAKIDKAVVLAAGKADWTDGLNPFADKPDALKRDIDTARLALRKANPVQQADVRGTAPLAKPLPTGGVPSSGVKTARFDLEQPSNALPAGGTTSPDKLKAQGLMKAGRDLVAAGKLTDARDKFADAAKLNASFSIVEDNPDKGLQDVQAKGKMKVDALVSVAKGFSEKKEYEKAVLALTDAKAIAVNLDLWSRDIDLELAKAKTAGGVVAAKNDLPDVLPDLPKVEEPTGLDLPKLPDAPKLPEPPKGVEPLPPEAPKPLDLDLPGLPAVPPPAKAEKPTAPKPVEPKPAEKPSKTDLGRKLLDDAADALKRGDFELASKLAVQAHNGDFGVKDDAQKLMAAVDVERLAAKGKETAKAFDEVMKRVSEKNYAYAERLLAEIDDTHLPADKQEQAKAVRAKVAEVSKKAAAPLELPEPTAKPDPKPAAGGLIPSTPGSDPLGSAKSAMEAELQQLRSECLGVQQRALKLFEQGDTDQAVQLLSDAAIKVKASKLPANRQKLLLDPIETKLDNFRLIKRQVDLYTKEAKDKKDRLENRLAKSSAEQQKQEEIAKRVGDIRELMERKDFGNAEKMAFQTKQLDPDNQTLVLLYDLCKRSKRLEDANRIKDEKEQNWLTSMNDADRFENVPTDRDPVKFQLDLAKKNKGRMNGDELYMKPKTVVERQIEAKLDASMRVNFKQASMREVLDKFALETQMNLSVDEPALADAGMELEKLMVTESIVQPISLRSILQVILEKHKLQFLVENDVLVVTTQKKAKGRLYTKVFSVMELVTPIPDFAIPESASLEKTFQHLRNPQQPWTTQPSTGTAGQLGGGTMVSGQQGAGYAPPLTGGGTLQSTPGGPQYHAIGASGTLAPTKANHSEQLMKLIKNMVRPNTWEDSAGPGRLAYYDIGGALVVNQTADVITEVNNLLESLRRLQDLSVAVEIRLVSLSEAFYEKIGVDFQMNLPTSGSAKASNRGFFAGNNTIAPNSQPNDLGITNTVVGWNPNSGGFTPDLNVPIRPNSYGVSTPPFGGYPGNGFGGLNLGLAFLNDIQVYMFLEAAAGDRRTNIMQAPKVTTFNGATASVSVTDNTFFVLGLQIINVGGQFVYLPQNTPVPTGIQVTVQPVVSSDRRFVRMTLSPNLTELTNANVPLFPVTAFITPVFEGGSQGTPIPFTQFFQQPSTSTISVQTTVVVPDGGTVVMGGLKTMSEGRNEIGPPVLSQVPYLNRLFKNTGVGRETRHLMLMVTPRIIITSEEEAIATGVGGN